MIFPEGFENKVGFDQIRSRLRAFCLSQSGATFVDQITFNTDPEVIRVLLKQTLEFRQIFEKGEDFPSQHYFDADDWLARIGLEGNYLEGVEFLNLTQALQTILACKILLSRSRENYPQLFRLSESVSLTGSIAAVILEKIDDRGFVKDHASPEMNRIRKKLREEHARLRKLSDQMFRQAVEQKLVPEGALPTIREGRIVIPILAEHKRRIKGFILDESATGQTVFMEPAEMLDTNNEIRDLTHAEKREEIRILRELTDRLRVDLPVLKQSFYFLSQIDFIRAKAKFAVEVNGDLPIIENRPELVWYNARHPLLFLSLKGKRDVVPLNIELSPAHRLLLVSGPNAGGKSVTLKTVGLLQYMVQCGLLIPVSDRSRVGVFQDIFIDIGDQQSIENDLSTYSSHLRNMSVFIQHAGERSLVLLDELGAGTDPNFGGAIAQAVLEGLLAKKVWGVATTHYYNLKLFAGQRQGITNAAMRFDDRNMVPLYVLDIGKPGSSFALEIARKTGLPSDTIQLAEKLVGKDLAGFETLVRSLERERQELSEKIRQLEKKEAALRSSLSKYEALSTDLETRKKEIISRAKEEAAILLKETNREIEKTIRHIRENKAERKETLKVRRNLENLSGKVAKTPERKQKPAEPIQVGDRVRIVGQEGSGTVQSIKGKSASVQFGELKSLVQISKLEKLTGKSIPIAESTTSRKSSGIDIHQKRSTFNSTLDVRGQRVEEVIPQLASFLDTAILLGQSALKIIHGKGEGILRKVIREQLSAYREVASISDEHADRGGDGITLVVLK